MAGMTLSVTRESCGEMTTSITAEPDAITWPVHTPTVSQAATTRQHD
jgi:hypothetical protein